jgi:hypothetical protein
VFVGAAHTSALLPGGKVTVGKSSRCRGSAVDLRDGESGSKARGLRGRGCIVSPARRNDGSVGWEGGVRLWELGGHDVFMKSSIHEGRVAT